MTGMTFFAITLVALLLVAYQQMTQPQRAMVPIRIEDSEEQG
ncbi:hypothetical protein [Ectobacillus sp. sgz5001026]